MKRILFILCIITSFFIFTSCKSVNLSFAEQVTGSFWSVTNPAGVSAELCFDIEDYYASLEITDTIGNHSVIKGTFAIDRYNIYITSAEFGKTYCFGYNVYSDRLELEYKDTVVVLFSEKPDDKKTEP